MKNLLKVLTKIFKAGKLNSNQFLYLPILILFLPILIFGQIEVGTIQRPGFIPFYLDVYEAGNKLFVSDWASNNLLIYDCTTLDLISELDLGASGIGMMVVHESTGKIYLDVHIGGIGKIAVIDATINELLYFIDDVYGTLRIDEGLGKVYILDRNRNDENLYVIDIATDAVNTVKLSRVGLFSNIKVNPMTHEVFIGYFTIGAEKLDIVDGVTMSRTTIDAPNGWDLAVNWLENKIYIILGPLNGYWVYDRDNGNSKFITDCPNDATLLFFNPSGNNVYTSSEVNHCSTIIDGKSDFCFNLPMFDATDQLAFCHATNHVYYVGYNNIVILHDQTQYVKQIQNSWLKTTGNGIIINQSTGRVFVNYYKNDSEASNTIVVIQDTELMIDPPVYVGDQGTFTTYVIDPVGKETIEEWYPTIYSARTLTVRPGGGRVYEPSGSSLNEYGGCADQGVPLITSFKTGGSDPILPVFTPDGSRIYVANWYANNIGVINSADKNVILTIPVGNSPWGAAITPDGSKLFVANKGDNTASVINTVTNTVKNTVTVGEMPWGVTINPSGTKAYFANSGSGTVSVIDINSEKVIAIIPIGSEPHWLTCTPDGHYVYVTNYASATVSVINTGIDSVVQTLSVGENPEAIAACPNGREVYLTTKSTVNVINTTDFSVNTVILPDPISPWQEHEPVPLAIPDPSSRIAGRVTCGGKPVRDVQVRAFIDGVEGGTASTNQAGDFSIFNLKAGTYDLEMSVLNYYPQTITGQTVDIGRTKVVHFSLVPFAPATPTLISPSDYAQNLSPTLTLKWNASTDADMFHLQVSSDLSFENKVFDDSTITVTFKKVGPLDFSTTYYWRVLAKNITGKSDWSDVWRFTTMMQRPDQVVLILPPDNALLYSDAVEFLWHKSFPDVEQYWLEFSQNQMMTNSLIDSMIMDSTKNIPDFILDNTYYWRVKAKNRAGWGPFSEIRNFKILKTGVNSKTNFPTEYALLQNYPNPFNSTTEITYAVPEPCNVSMKIFNINGMCITTLINSYKQPGYHSVSWNGRNQSGHVVCSGLYICKIQTVNYEKIIRMIMIK